MLKYSNNKASRGGGQALKPPYSNGFEGYSVVMSLRGGVFHEFCRNQIFPPDVVIPSFKSELYCNNEIATLPSVARNDSTCHPELVWLLLPKSSDFVQNVPYRTGSVSSLFPSLGREGVGMGFSPKSEYCFNNEIATHSSNARNDKSFNVNKNNVTLNLFQGLSIGFSKIQSCINQIDRFRNKFGMTNSTKRCAFTLSELLLALIIVGVLAVITIPILLNNIQKKYFATQIKNFSAQIEQLAKNEMIVHRTKDLNNTDFASPFLLFKSKHFNIVKTCSVSKSRNDCWKAYTYKTLYNANAPIHDRMTVILKNGIMFSYYERVTNQNAIDKGGLGVFQIDVNGIDKPNIGGRDLFYIYIDKKGRLYGHSLNDKNELTLKQKINKCKNSSYVYCYDVLSDNNWKMDY